jgi:predicted nucleotidyltransferase
MGKRRLQMRDRRDGYGINKTFHRTDKETPMKAHEKFLCASEKTAMALFALRVKSLLGNNLMDLKLFGSKVRGDYDRDSDLDVLIVVKNRDNRIQDAISEIVSELNIEFDCVLSPVIYTKDEYNRNRYCKTLFSKNIALEGVSL